MHKILERQIKKHLGENPYLPKEFQALLEAISVFYDHNDEDRMATERSMALSSRELENRLKEFEAAKTATLNLLEDLDNEKKGVEKKVEERTQELSLAKAYDDAILESMAEGLIATDNVGRITLANKTAIRNLGWSAEEIKGMSADTILQIKDRQGKQQQQQQQQLERRGYYTKKDGSLLPVEAMTTPILNPDPVGTITIFRDITKEEQLEQSKTDFLAIASHEMRTPLTIIKGKAERILKNLTTNGLAKIKDEAANIKQNSDRLLGIVNDFLDVILLEDQRIRLNIESIEVAGVIKEVISELDIKAKEKNLELILKPSSSSTNLQSDRSRIKQILLNLINNSLNYTEKGNITITTENIGQSLYIRITDTGIGIPPEKQPLLFKRFSTVSGAFMHSKEYGSGMGLYISHLLVGAMGGQLVLERSTPGVGTTFAVILPLHINT